MSMKHTYYTGAIVGPVAQYTDASGADALECVAESDTGIAVIASPSPYGQNALQLKTSSNPGEARRVSFVETNGKTEFRAHWVMDMPAIASGEWLDTALITAGTDAKISFDHTGSFQFYIGGARVHDSGPGKMPAAGTRIRISLALSLTHWSIAVFHDGSQTAITTAHGTTTAFSGTFGNLYVGKASWQSGADMTLVYRAFRVETGPGCAGVFLPQESLLRPASGKEVVPIRTYVVTGSQTTPAGIQAVVHLADKNPATTVTLPAHSVVRFAVRPVDIAAGVALRFVLSAAHSVAAGTMKVSLYRMNHASPSRVGAVKTMSVGTAATDAVALFTATELNGLTPIDTEALELEIVSTTDLTIGGIHAGANVDPTVVTLVRKGEAVARVIRKGIGEVTVHRKLASTPLLPNGIPGNWSLILNDEFASSTLNPAVWFTLRNTPDNPWAAPYDTTNDNCAFSPDYATVENGHLRLRWDNTPITDGGKTYDYTTGMATTINGLHFTYGFIEARIWLPEAPGVWPAFWLLASSGDWPPELDIAEWPRDNGATKTMARFNIHWKDAGGAHQQIPGWPIYSRDATGWHTYGLLWQAGRAILFFDGAEKYRFEGPGVPSESMYILLTTGIERGYAPAPDHILIDYLRVWQQQ